MALRLDQVDWSDAIDVATRRHADATIRAPLLSLSSLYTTGFGEGLARINKARQIDPFNPLHELRRALFMARFGELESASNILSRLKEQLPEVPLIDYQRALFALRGGRPEQARAITATLETAHPDFTHGKFLRAEAQIVLAAKAGNAERHLTALPTGAKWDSLWVDLLIKLVLLHPQDGPALARRHLEKKISGDSPLRALVQKAITWVGASADELGVLVGNEAPNSRGEALVLECLVKKLTKIKSEDAARMVTALRRKYPERGALRRVRHAVLTRIAAELAAEKHYDKALRILEQCLREEPQDAINYQNRAALFSMLRETDSYHEAWAALNAHQYRLLLLGSVDPLTLAQVTKTHRLFAQQARGGTDTGNGMARGIFRYVESNSDEKARVVANVEAVNSDPDLLRQWIHHSSAELVFRHMALGTAGRRVLLEPLDRDEALMRVESLNTLAESLSVLVPGEGAALANALSERWNDAAAMIRTRYTDDILKSVNGDVPNGAEARPDEDEANNEEHQDEQFRQLQEEHLYTLADGCLMCVQWRPPFAQLWIAEELLKFVETELAFFDEKVLRRIERRAGYETPYALRVFSSQIQTITGLERASQLSADQRRTVIEGFMAELLREMASSAYEGFRGSAKDAAVRAMTMIERARALRSANEDIELTAARLLFLGEFYDDARLALERFRRFVKPDNTRAIETADRLDELLRERHKQGQQGHKWQRDLNADDEAAGSDSRVQDLLRDLDRSPRSWQIYNELVKELVIIGRFDEAIQWADRSVAQCLSRAEQINARGLAIEARGMTALAKGNPRAARLYAVGAHEPARKAIEALSEGRERNYSLDYLLGRCQLAAGMTDEARASFEAAAKSCDRQLYQTILRRLTADIDTAYLAVARNAVDEALRDGNIDEAVKQAASVFGRMKEPAAWLVDFARVFYSAALSRVGAVGGDLTVPLIPIETSWKQQLQDALAQPHDVERALRLAALAERIHPASARVAQALSERARTLQHQMAAVAALNEAGRLLAERQFEQVLVMFEKFDPKITAEPRLIRIQVLALLGLNRFEEADKAVGEIGETYTAEVRDFIAHYPSLVFRQRIALAQQQLRDAKHLEAIATLRDAKPPGERERRELDYCRAFGAALEGYEFRRERRLADARAQFENAMALLEPHLGPSSEETKHIAELYDRLEKEIEIHAAR